MSSSVKRHQSAGHPGLHKSHTVAESSGVFLAPGMLCIEPVTAGRPHFQELAERRLQACGKTNTPGAVSLEAEDTWPVGSWDSSLAAPPYLPPDGPSSSNSILFHRPRRP